MKRYLGAALLIAAAACGAKKDKATPVQTATIARRDIVIDAQASGVVEPIAIVEVKSKASGMITKMPVETGTLVQPGDLLVQIDTRDVNNQLAQAKADADASQARYEVSVEQKKRSDAMFAARVITAQEHETAALDLRSAAAAKVRADANVDLAQQRLDDARVTAQTAGTVIEKTVQPGVVIASATGSVSGGTTLLKMADLTRVRIRALFNESDIGLVRGGQTATVNVDAYQNRPFTGLVEKIEPQAVIQQNVTMFPVLITLDNRENLLKPGMNGEVVVTVSEIPDAIAVPNDAVRTTREAAAIATMLNMDPDSVTAEVRSLQGSGRGGRGGAGGSGGGGGASAGTGGGTTGSAAGGSRTGSADGEVALGDVALQQGGQSGSGRGQQVQVSPEECATINATIDKHPKEKAKLDDLRQQMTAARGAGGDVTPIRTQQGEIYKAIGVDQMKAGRCRGGRGGANGGTTGAAGGTTKTGGSTKTGGANSTKTAGGRGAAGQNSGQLQPSGELSGQQRRKTGLVFVATDTTNKKFAPRVIQLGQGNFDYTEVLNGGLAEGDRVVLVSALMLQAQRQAQNDRTRSQMGVPGLNPNAANPGAGGRGPGGGGPGGGGGGGGAGGAGGAGGRGGRGG